MSPNRFARFPNSALSSKPENGALSLGQEPLLQPELKTVAEVLSYQPRPTHKRRLLPLLATAAFVLAGCAGQIESQDFSGLHGQLVGVDQAGLSTAGFSDDFTYHSSVEEAVAQAKAKGIDEYDVRRELTSLSVKTDVSARVTSGNATAEVIRLDPKNAGRYEADIPYQLHVSPSADGQWQVEITAIDCLAAYPNKCSAPVSTVVSGQYDGTAPSVNLDQIRPADDGSGLLLTGNISDGPGGSGISSASISSCDGSWAEPLQLNGGNSFSVVRPPKTNDNCFVAHGTDTVNHEATSPQASFSYSILVNPSLIKAPDGKLLIQGSASSNLWAPTQVHLDRCVVSGCANIDTESGITLNPDGSITSKGISPQLGSNSFTAWVADRFGNTQKATPLEIIYDFSVAASSQVESNGSITIKAQPKSNMMPKFTVEVRPGCDGNTVPIMAAAQNDGSFIATGIAPNVGKNCIEVAAVDSFGQRVLTQTTPDYQFGIGEMRQELQYNDMGARLFLFGIPPENVNTSTIAVYGSQHDWRAWGKEKGFMCSPYKGDLQINGEKMQYAIVCDLPSNAGDATIRFDFKDKFGHQFSLFYPNNNQYIIDLRDNPPFNQLVLFLAPYLATIASVVTASGSAGAFAYKRQARKMRGQRGQQFLGMVGNGEKMEQYILQEQTVPSRLFRIGKDEIGQFRKIEKLWEIARKGDIPTAVSGLLSLDSKRHPELEQIRLSLIQGILHMIQKRLGEVEQRRESRMLNERSISRLIDCVDTIQQDVALWKNVDQRLAFRVAERSSIHT